ncbi:cytochrome P450 [Microdochium bolleyi]|uniref:Cytochrome P450 n=1 Tax=Microdochium bolleyi TaxID=196109 RepID=A0A136ITJ9_9PEZI|nr:cytochrome P450 [Microdochium bolleyi]
MESFPWKPISVSSALASFLLVKYGEGSVLDLGVAGTFLASWLAQAGVVVIYSVFLYPKFLSPLIGLPEPSGGSWWNGHFATIIKEPSGSPQRRWASTLQHDGVIRYLGPFNQERLLVVGPKGLSEILVTKSYQFIKPPSVRAFLVRLLGNGVLVAEGDAHKAQRKNLMPAFAFRHIKDLYPVFWRKSRDSVHAITDFVDLESSKAEAAGPQSAKRTAVLEVGDWGSRATLDIVGTAGLGRDFGSLRDPDNELTRVYGKLFKPNRQAMILGVIGLIVPEWILVRLPFKRNGDILHASNYIRNVCHDLVREKKVKLQEKGETDVDILSVALESGGFTDEDLVDQLMTFLAAGHETTATSMTWALYMLAKNPEMQQRLRDEVREHLPSMDSDQNVTSLQIDHLPYLNAFCSEVLRYWAPVPMTLRHAAEETTLQDIKVPKGTRIMLCSWATNFDTQLWGPDATQFNPERWLTSESATAEEKQRAASGGATSNYANMTFLHGPRSCIGQAFAKAEFACLLATWVGRFQFDLKNEEDRDEAGLDIKGGATARPSRGLYVHAAVVEGW